jgi:serine protease Do
MAQQILPQLIKNGKVERGWLGISMGEVNADLAEKLNLDMPRGALVKAVGMDSPAQKAGIQRGDVIISFAGQEIRDIHHLRNIVGATEVGKSVEVIVLRKGGEEKRLTVKLGKRTAEGMVALNERRQEQKAFAGLSVQDLTPAIAERYGYSAGETGVIVTQVAIGSDAEKKGIKPGFLIQEMEWMAIDNLETYTRVTKQLEAENKKRILLYVRLPNGRGGDYVTIAVSPLDR